MEEVWFAANDEFIFIYIHWYISYRTLFAVSSPPEYFHSDLLKPSSERSSADV
jgi:hypothetical protein